MHNRRGHFYLIFSRYDYRTMGSIIYCHFFFNWSLVLWNQLKSPSAWKRTSVTWMEQLSSDTKPPACPCSVHSLYLCAYCTHSSDPVTNGQPSTSSFTPGIHISNPSSDHLQLSREGCVISWRLTDDVENMQCICHTRNDSAFRIHIWSGGAFLGNQTYDLGTVNRNAKVKA